MRNLISLSRTALRKYGFAFCFAVALWFSIFIGTFGSLHPLSAQTTQDSVRAEIEEYAERHAKNSGAMDTGLIIELFGEEAEEVGFTTREIAEIYEEAYIEASAPNPESPWSVFLPKPEWVIIAVLAVLAALNSAFGAWLKDKFSKLIKWFDDKVFAGNPLFLRRYLDRYQKALLEKHSSLKIPFRLNRPLDMAELYVPLKVIGTADHEQVEARQAFADVDNKRLMVKGPPGSGKSILLRKLTLDYASRKLELIDQPIPVLLELHRLSEPNLTVEKLVSKIVQALARDDFPRAYRFVQRSLDKGQLMLLLDGLDEINSSIRKHTAQIITDLLDLYPCRAVITCRTQVYEGEFDTVSDQTLEIVEFSDQQIRRFLRAWKEEMPPEKSVEHLIVTLRDRPRIMALARNPLLLTIIAYLYTDTPFVLPHSRAEFYQKATDILLEQWQKDFNQYKAINKKRILQHLALYNQDNADPQQKDRRSMDRYTVLEQIKQILPRLNLDSAKDTEPILAEIVERSGLLLRIDGGERYQFAHLTLQEYFSAAALVVDKSGLISRFQHDPDAWRETVKLWCGLAGNSTELVEAVYQIDALTGFECLADAQEVDEALATQIISYFEQQFYNQVNSEEELTRAFGIVAADIRPRGKQVFLFLEQQLKASQLEQAQKAANALAATNLPIAAQAITALYETGSNIQDSLVKMGDLAINPLKKLIEKNNSLSRSLDALNSIRKIGTPDAGLALTDFLWNKNPVLSGRTAWYLVSLILLPEVEEAINQYELTIEQRNAEQIEWIWQPFQTKADSSISTVAGRIAYLIELSKGEALPRGELQDARFDPRICIPLYTIRAVQLQKIEWKAPWNDQAESLLFNIDDSQSTDSQKYIDLQTSISIADFLRVQTPDARYDMILSSLEPKLCLQVIRQMSQSRQPNINDWKNQFHHLEYRFSQSKQYFFVLLLSIFMTAAAVAEIIYLISLNVVWVIDFFGAFLFILINAWITMAMRYSSRFKSHQLNSNLFRDYIFLGVWTVVRQSLQFSRHGVVWKNTNALYSSVYGWAAGSGALVVHLSGIFAVSLSNNNILSTYSNSFNFDLGALIGSVTLSGALAGAGAIAGSSSSFEQFILSFSLVLPLALALIWFNALSGSLFAFGFVVISGFGLGYWRKQLLRKGRKSNWCFLTILAFPLFCSAPITLGFCLGALYHFVPGITTWWQAAAVLSGIVLLCTAVWQYGQWKDRKATNPLHGLLDPKQYGIEVK